jgi:hypothetical protein
MEWKSSKLQAPSSREAPNFKLQKYCGAHCFEFGAWCFSGAWTLVLGCFMAVSY